MSDLIKREEVLKVIHDYFKEFIDYIEAHEEESHLRDIFMVLAENKKLCTKIKEIPVAYDVEQVVKELEELISMFEENNSQIRYERYCKANRKCKAMDCFTCVLSHAIEIVKGGGVNER